MRLFAILAILVGAAFAAGCGSNPSTESGAGAGAGAPAAVDAGGAPREMAIEVTDAGFVPATTVIGRGEAVTLVFTRKTEQTCATDVMFPRLGLKYELPLDREVRVDIPAGAVEDTLYFACGMNMITGMVEAQ